MTATGSSTRTIRRCPSIRRLFGIDYRRTLAQIIEQNTGIDVQDHVFEAVEE